MFFADESLQGPFLRSYLRYELRCDLNLVLGLVEEVDSVWRQAAAVDGR